MAGEEYEDSVVLLSRFREPVADCRLDSPSGRFGAHEEPDILSGNTSLLDCLGKSCGVVISKLELLPARKLLIF